MIRINILEEYVDPVLKEAGYAVHKNGIFEGGYIKYIDHRHRWHAKPKGTDIEIHQDKTVNNLHKMIRDVVMDSKEKKLIIRVREKIYSERKKKVKIPKSVPIFAPNLKEIQKNHPPIVKSGWYQNLIERMKKFYNAHNITSSASVSQGGLERHSSQKG